MSESERWLTVRETAERLAVSEETVRRMIRNFELPASKKHAGSRAPWVVNATALERQLAADAERVAIRKRLAGMGGGYGPQGRQAAVDAVAAHLGWTQEQRDAEEQRLRDRDDRNENIARADRDREAILARAAHELHADPAIRQRFEQLDDETRIEAEAREIAARVRREERVRERVRELLEEDDT